MTKDISLIAIFLFLFVMTMILFSNISYPFGHAKEAVLGKFIIPNSVQK